MKDKKLIRLLIAFMAIIFIVQLDINDCFTHGFVSDGVDIDVLESEDIERYVDISQESISLRFTPQKDHFAGFVLYFAKQNEDVSGGNIVLKISDEQGKILDIIELYADDLRGKSTYNVYSNARLYKSVEYTLEVYSKECISSPQMLMVNSDYRAEECRDSNLLMNFAYEESTFSDSEKILISLFVIALAIIGIAMVEDENKFRNKKALYIGVDIILIVLLAWNYNFNTFNRNNDKFNDFDKMSENLVLSSMKMEELGVNYSFGVGLDKYDDYRGDWYSSNKDFINDDSRVEGYNTSIPEIVLNTSHFCYEQVKVGNWILFSNGDMFQIEGVDIVYGNTGILLNANRPLNHWKYGSLADIRIIDNDGNVLNNGWHEYYASQFGLQGIIARYLSRVIDESVIKTILVLITAVVFFFVSYIVYKKYNLRFAVVFYLTFLLSPWVVNFASNLYWVEFTWFIPMLAGLICSLKIDSKKIRIISYIVVFLSITIKCLCGYEYISTVMMGAILFLIADLVVAFAEKKKEKQKLILKTIIVMGTVAIAGFVLAMSLHAIVRPNSDGNVFHGIRMIIEEDALRRTYGSGNNRINATDDSAVALVSSSWEVVRGYFHFSTDIIAGIEGYLFPILFLIATVLLIVEKNSMKKIERISLFVISLLTTLSWFILAKSHSYVHVHLNYVLWYFGFVQCMLCVLVDNVYELIHWKNIKN